MQWSNWHLSLLNFELARYATEVISKYNDKKCLGF